MEKSADRRAVTLFELIVTVSVMTALSSVGIIRYQSSLAHRRAELAGKKIAADIGLVQQAAMTAQADRTIVFDVATSAYDADDVPDPQRPTRQLAVRLASAPFDCVLAGVDFDGTAKLTFDGRGRPASGGTIRVESGSHARTILVDAETGLVEVQP